MSDDIYIYNARDIAIMLEALFIQLQTEGDMEAFHASCELIETIIFNAREKLADMDPGHG